MKRALNAKLLDAAGKPRKRVKYGDAQVKNLIVVIEPSGKIFWKWQGRVGDNVREASLGQYPVMGVAEARKAAAAITEDRDLAKMKGESFELPRIRRHNAPTPAATIENASVEVPVPATPTESKDCDWLWDLYMKHEGGKKASGDEKQRSWDKDIKPFIGHKPYADICYDDLAEVIAAKAETAPGAANHLVSYIKRCFRWAVTKGRPFTKLAVNPAFDLVKPSESNALERFLDDEEIVLFFKAADALADAFSDGLVHTLYNGTRKSETFDMPWDEYDERTGFWLLPKDRVKNGDELLLPLAPSSQARLKARRAFSGNGVYVFPSTLGDQPMGGFTKLMDRFRNKMNEIAVAAGREEVPHWTIHDLRRTLSTGMNGLADAEGAPLVPAEIVERVLNHRIKGVARTYNRHDYLPEKRRALLLWAEHLDRLRARCLQPVMEQAA